MNPLSLHEFHDSLGANFSGLNGAEIVADYGNYLAEYTALRESAGVLDFSFRSRICLIGNDRVRFLHGQVTNDIKKLRPGAGCYSAITTAKGKMQSDLNIFNLPDELLLDFEPGLTEKISQRLEQFIVADDVQIVDAAPHYGLLSVQGPQAEKVIRNLELFPEFPALPFASLKIADATLGEIYLVNHARLNPCSSRREEAQNKIGNRQSAVGNILEPPHVGYYAGFDLFIPNHSLGAVADKLIAAAKQTGGCAAGWNAFETARIEAGIPRFGADMDETNIPLECGIESRAIVYNKGCYIGQEVINRIHSVGHVNRELRALRLATDLELLPKKGDKFFHAGKEVGYVTSAVKSPLFKANLALGYVRREVNQIGNELVLRVSESEGSAKIVELLFQILK